MVSGIFNIFRSVYNTLSYFENWNGPWEIPDDDVFDTRADYAIKTASDGKRRFAFGWIASKYGNTDFGPWEWGGTMNFHEIIQNSKTENLELKLFRKCWIIFRKRLN